MAVSSGAPGLEAVAVLGERDAPRAGDLAVIRDFAGDGVAVHLAAPDGTVVTSTTS
jgi:hypothetical protein